jgi:hypothetical protein
VRAEGEHRFTGHYCFVETTITGHVLTNILEPFLVSQLDVNNVIPQQDEEPTNYSTDVTRYRNRTFLGRWIHSVATQIT